MEDRDRRCIEVLVTWKVRGIGSCGLVKDEGG
jgi:hypothetical protein